MGNLAGKVAVATGASKGIGSGIAKALAAAGARVAVTYSSDRDGAERVAQEIMHRGGEAIVVGADVSNAADVTRLFAAVDAALGRVDVFVNKAGIFRFRAFVDITEETFHAHYNINVLGSIVTVQEAVKRFGPDGGSIINISSIVASHPNPRPAGTSRISRRWRCFWHPTNRRGSPARLFAQQAESSSRLDPELVQSNSDGRHVRPPEGDSVSTQRQPMPVVRETASR
jgi:NAD(P)-dependent dehydrogenase (short-subunit alcohol dehydrogenase family)